MKNETKTENREIKMEQLYFQGDLAEYTGETEILYGELFYEIKLLNGHKKDEIRYVVLVPKNDEPQQTNIATA